MESRGELKRDSCKARLYLTENLCSIAIASERKDAASASFAAHLSLFLAPCREAGVCKTNTCSLNTCPSRSNSCSRSNRHGEAGKTARRKWPHWPNYHQTKGSWLQGASAVPPQKATIAVAQSKPRRGSWLLLASGLGPELRQPAWQRAWRAWWRRAL